MYDYFLETSVAASMSEAELEKVSEAEASWKYFIPLVCAVSIS